MVQINMTEYDRYQVPVILMPSSFASFLFCSSLVRNRKLLALYFRDVFISRCEGNKFSLQHQIIRYVLFIIGAQRGRFSCALKSMLLFYYFVFSLIINLASFKFLISLANSSALYVDIDRLVYDLVFI